MINPGENDFIENEPLGSAPSNEGESLPPNEGSRGRGGQRVSRATAESWEESNEKGSLARRTDYFLRENPIPTIIGALALGLAIGWALRHATAHEEKEVEVQSPLGAVNLSFLTLPFLWPFFKSVREKYRDSAEVVKDSVDRIKSVDVDRYTKPIRKRWKAWTK
jgi:hypothetical protein